MVDQIISRRIAEQIVEPQLRNFPLASSQIYCTVGEQNCDPAKSRAYCPHRDFCNVPVRTNPQQS